MTSCVATQVMTPSLQPRIMTSCLVALVMTTSMVVQTPTTVTAEMTMISALIWRLKPTVSLKSKRDAQDDCKHNHHYFFSWNWSYPWVISSFGTANAKSSICCSHKYFGNPSWDIDLR